MLEKNDKLADADSKKSFRGSFRQSQIKNMSFNVVFTLTIVLFLTFVLAAIGGILVKGVPGLASSLASEEILFSIRLSFITSVISTVLCLVFALPIAYGMERFNIPGRKLFNALLDVPLALPPIVSGVALLLLFGTTEFGRMLASHGFKFVFTVKGIIIAQFFVNIPYMIRVLKSTIADINPRLEFVARTMGCSQLQVFLRVTLPLAKNGLVAGIVITWARALGEFGGALMLAGATRMKTETLPISLFLNMSTGDLPEAMAAATILIVCSVISLFIFELLGGKQTELSRMN